MSTPDPRAEVRDMIAAKIHAADCGCPDWHPGDEDTYYDDLADAVMELFPEVWQHHAATGPCYVLRTAPAEDTEMRTDT